MVKMGFDRNQLVESLGNRIQNEVCAFDFLLLYLSDKSLTSIHVFQGTVAYYLLLDNRFRVSSGYLGAEFQETMVGFFAPIFFLIFH